MDHGRSDVDSAKQLSGMQEAYERQEEEREDLEAELEKAQIDLQVGSIPIPSTSTRIAFLSRYTRIDICNLDRTCSDRSGIALACQSVIRSR